MTKEELKQRIQDLEDKLKSDKNLLYKEYLNANNKVKKGDTISDGSAKIIVDRITYTFGMDGIPCCLYHGKWLTAKGLVNKNQQIATIVQTRLEEINGDKISV